MADWVSGDDYPASAIRGWEEGTVRFSLGIDEGGSVETCAIVQSSGSAALDETTCRIMRERGKFRPARNSEGRAVASAVRSAIRWVLPEPAFDELTPGMVIIALDLSERGEVEACRAEAQGFPVELGESFGCDGFRQHYGPSFFTPLGKSYKTLRAVVAMSADDRKFSVDSAGWGVPLIQTSARAYFNADGEHQRCELSTSFSGGMAHFSPDLCGRFKASPGTRDAVPAHVFVTELAIFGEPRGSAE